MVVAWIGLIITAIALGVLAAHAAARYFTAELAHALKRGEDAHKIKMVTLAPGGDGPCALCGASGDDPCVSGDCAAIQPEVLP